MLLWNNIIFIILRCSGSWSENIFYSLFNKFIFHEGFSILLFPNSFFLDYDLDFEDLNREVVEEEEVESEELMVEEEEADWAD